MGQKLKGLINTRSGAAAGQLRAELDWLIALFKRENVRSYLEIGARSGDTFFEIMASLPQGSRGIALDMPGARWGYKGTDADLRQSVGDLRLLGYNAKALLGDSHSGPAIRAVQAEAPFDAVLIDGDHTLNGLTADWNNYGKLGRIVALHDIAWKRPVGWQGTRIEVPEFWEANKTKYRHEEIRAEAADCGIGVLFRD